MILFARPVHRVLHERLGEAWLFPHALELFFWTGMGLITLPPLVAVWRNMEALVMMFAESITAQSTRRQTLQPALETVMKAVFSLALLIWILALLPFAASLLWAALAIGGILLLFTVLFWSRLVFLHSLLEIELRNQMQIAMGDDAQAGATIASMLKARQEEWRLQAEEFLLPAFSTASGRRIGDLALRRRFGASVASIDRGGVIIPNPTADSVLYPNDKLLLLGSPEQIDCAVRELCAVRRTDAQQQIGEFGLESLDVPEAWPDSGKTLRELDFVRRFDVQVAGIRRGQLRIITPSGDDTVESGDHLLVLGSSDRIREFRLQLGGGRL